ncbi:phenazine biosynthesis protein PhzF [Kaistia algarum]|uniref:PhzF family phenazine biosynthesis protein n=1 Tax=Kaistia algarum TaxID=2083279 RepID=UPI000CE8B9B4|nr:PhzF family phenazine biosynthesis protein [Kaistia algarum]MCX5515999.1 PhzF family phenazine biosynthesis protein [Kaistia algarum]PPE80647.1 phenazine biosynthesis protein PhzF [Kaistia algarum]
MSRPYAILDVFSDAPLAGNQLAVVLDAGGLDDAQMQAIAAEFNLAETVFVLPAERPGHRARLRIFSPASELPFAGHPTVGTAVLLAIEDRGATPGVSDVMLLLEENVGPIRCVVAFDGERSGHAIFDAPELARPLDVRLDRERAAAALGLAASEIGFENHEISAFTAGVPYCFVPVRNLAAIASVVPLPQYWADAFPAKTSVYLYTRETEGLLRAFHGRMFWRAPAFVEDPATGSAAAAFAGVVQKFDQPTSGSHRLTIEQGFEMGRPSLIDLEIDIAEGHLRAVRIGGDAVIIARGTLYV